MYVSVYMHTCMYSYICIYTCMHSYRYTHICKHKTLGNVSERLVINKAFSEIYIDYEFSSLS